MNKWTVCAVALLALTGAAAHAAKWKGTIAVKGKHSEAELSKMAKISEADAKKAALAAVKGGESVSASELEVENGYLIYSVEVKVKGKTGVDEVTVDAGTGKVLGKAHESPADEAKEKAAEKKEKK